ncbi:MAG: 1-deoxy-D-xylulose-5-phosphate reductoisomerase [Planctomycetota bacterium]
MPTGREPSETRVIILGSTGSVGTQTVQVIEHLNALAQRGEHPRRYRVVGLASGKNGAQLAEQAASLGVASLAIADPDADCDRPAGCALRRGPDAAEQLVRETETDVIVAAIVGIAGLASVHAAVELGRKVLLANKETLVAAGGLIVPLAAETGARLLPLDSEHSALWQCLGLDHAPPYQLPEHVERLILTASGGALRDWPADRVAEATAPDALAHPTWDMGAKVTIDSASLTNKAFELLEAHWLFGAPGDRLEAVIHPQSIVHSLVEFRDGALLAQLGDPDMRTPIQIALAWPDRPDACARRMDLTSLARLDFAAPDLERFPALGLAHEVMRIDADAGHPTTAGAAFNGANEEAVRAFLAGEIRFATLAETTIEAVRSTKHKRLKSIRSAIEADEESRAIARDALAAAR